jgi:hypothetical protein
VREGTLVAGCRIETGVQRRNAGLRYHACWTIHTRIHRAQLLPLTGARDGTRRARYAWPRSRALDRRLARAIAARISHSYVAMTDRREVHVHSLHPGHFQSISSPLKVGTCRKPNYPRTSHSVAHTLVLTSVSEALQRGL